ncbi:MAG: ABC-F family ATP-binding cassette domain-containing protein [Kiritimatiellae bacterium]|jgi:ATP-binding cassette subfamily F protein 3|nr:ABC-F family ATP-binding cassette domain-containing protein [Kiritimatiellia bacterium]
MIEFRDVSMRYGVQEILGDVNFRVNKGERVGIVGPNGGGKSTLFRLIMGEDDSDKGQVIIEESPRIGYIRQHLKADNATESLLEYALRGIPGLFEMEVQIHALEHKLTESKDESERSRLLKRIGTLQSKFEHLGGYEIESRVKASLGGLGFETEAFERPFASFSGGWRMRAELSRVLASQPDLLLLDEPSNYLDLPAIDWLQRFLRGYEGTLMLISHDRYLLRTLTTTTIEVDANTATRYNGNLDYYLREREVRYTNLLAAKENQDKRKEQLERFVERFKAKATKATQAQSRVKMLEKLKKEEIKLPKRSLAASHLRIPPPPHSGAEIFRAENLSFSYDGSNNILNNIEFSIGKGDKIAIIGYNGMGKTTLLRLIAGTRKPTTGVAILGHKVSPGYLSQEFSETIPPDISVYECAKRSTVGATDKFLRSNLAGFGFGPDDITKQAGVLSGGEKIRLAFLRLFLNPPNLMLLDEPTTHLDLEGRDTLENSIREYSGTVCLVSHDIEFVRNTATSIIEITPQGIRRFPGGYDYYKEKTAKDSKPQAQKQSKGPEKTSDSSPISSKELRKARAKERAKYQPRIKDLKRRVNRAETKIVALEEELETLSEVLFNPQPDTDFSKTNQRLRFVQDELERYTEGWERDGAELEKLQQKANAGSENHSLS